MCDGLDCMLRVVLWKGGKIPNWLACQFSCGLENVSIWGELGRLYHQIAGMSKVGHLPKKMFVLCLLAMDGARKGESIGLGHVMWSQDDP